MISSSTSIRDPMPWLTQARPGIHVQEGPPAHRVPLRHERDGLADDMEIAPAFGEPALAPVRGAAPVSEHQVHRRAGAVGGIGGGPPAARPVLEVRPLT